MLTIFYDGHCPLCAAEMKTLQSLDTQNKLRLENIHDENFQHNYPYIDPRPIDYCMVN
jgi:predicted DCC family thiol-disulfide oxidoreductase YuxK